MEAEPFDAGPFVTCPACKHEHRERETCGTGGSSDDVVLPRADFDALVKRDSTCPLCGDDLDPDEADYDSDIPPAGAGVCSRCFCRWHDAPVYEKRAKEATARADALAALLKEARGYVTYGIGEGDPHGIGAAMLARIDAALEVKK